MAGLCKATIVGNLGRDPEKRYTQDGRAITRFSVAATTRRKDREGEWQDHTEWFNVTVFNRQAETLAERLAKGTRVYVEGRLESRTYDTPTGGKGFALDLVANEVLVLDSRQRAEGEFGSSEYDAAPAASVARAPQPNRAAPAHEDATDLEDLPF
jgi:single-strand DNA-binding protein